MDKPGALEFILCADDYGLSPGVSQGILEAVHKGRLSAVGSMMNRPGMSEMAQDLRAYRETVDLGVHLVLTDLPALSPEIGRFPSIGALTRRAYMGRLPAEALRKEIGLQLEAFTRHFDKAPEFVDGHHHVHHLPGVRDIVLDVLGEKFPGEKPALRCCWEDLPTLWRRGVAVGKAALIGFPGRAFAKLARGRGFHTNAGFSGVYDFSGRTPYETLFERFTWNMKPNSLLMCHPGRVDRELVGLDSLTDQRERELEFFLSDRFPAMLADKRLALGRFPRP